MIINNFSKIKPLLRFDENSNHDNFYRFCLMIRDKDGKNAFLNKQRKEYIVKDWYIESLESLENHEQEMKYLTNLVKGRLYFSCDMKSLKKCLIELHSRSSDKLIQHLENPMFGTSRMLTKILPSICQVAGTTAKNGKMVMFDVDTKDLKTLRDLKESLGKFYLETLDSKNGYHVLAERKFDTNKFKVPENVTLCLNSLALAYMNIEDI